MTGLELKRLLAALEAGALMFDTLPSGRIIALMVACFLFYCYLHVDHVDRMKALAATVQHRAPRIWRLVLATRRRVTTWLGGLLDGLAEFWSSQMPCEHSRAVASMKLFVLLLVSEELLCNPLADDGLELRS